MAGNRCWGQLLPCVSGGDRLESLLVLVREALGIWGSNGRHLTTAPLLSKNNAALTMMIGVYTNSATSGAHGLTNCDP